MGTITHAKVSSGTTNDAVEVDLSDWNADHVLENVAATDETNNFTAQQQFSVSAAVGAGASSGVPVDGAFIVNMNSSAVPPFASYLDGLELFSAQFAGPNGISNLVTANGYGGFGGFGSIRYNGTLQAPTNVLSGQTIGTHSYRGYGATAISKAVGQFLVSSNEDFTDTAQGTRAEIWAVPNGSAGGAGQNRVATFWGSRGVSFGSLSSTDPGSDGGILSTKGTLTGGTLAAGGNVLSITATQPATPVATQSAISLSITGAGSASFNSNAVLLVYNAGYTGANTTRAFSLANANAGTASTLVPASGTSFSSGNMGVGASASATTTGLNFGMQGFASGGDINMGASGMAQNAKTGAGTKTNIGVMGSAYNAVTGGSTPVQIGGFFCLNQTTTPAVSAGLIADNGAQTDPIFLARDNGTTVFTIADGGASTFTAALAAASFTGSGSGITALPLTTGVTGVLPQANGAARNGGGALAGANFNVTTDQAIAITLPTGYTKYRVLSILIANPSISLTTAVGGFYTAASKAGTQVVANTQVYSALTTGTAGAAGSMLIATVANGNSAFYNAGTIYFSLTTAQGAAATADIAIHVQPIS